MAKTIIRACDLCKSVDGTKREDGTVVTVRNTTVVGATAKIPRKDLCDAERWKLLEMAGYTPDECAAIMAEHDTEKTRKPRTTKTETATESAPKMLTGDALTLTGAVVDGADTVKPDDSPPPTASNGKAKATAGAK